MISTRATASPARQDEGRRRLPFESSKSCWIHDDQAQGNPHAFLLLLSAYIAAYVCLSRRGYLEAERFGFPEFYYFAPKDSDTWRYANYGCVYLFSPLNKLDRALGSGLPPCSEPLWGLSK
jgi:hypothetical protein